VTTSLIAQLTIIAVAAVLAPILSELSGRLAVPGVVIEIVLGVLIGPQVLGWTSPTGFVLDFSNMGLALLMFLAGAELDLALLRGRPLKLAVTAWGGSLVLAAGVALVMLLTGSRHGEIVTGLALSTTALGTLLPIVRDSGLLERPLGRHVLATGSIGEFGPIVLVALVLSGKNPGVTTLLLVGFALLATGSAFAASRPAGQRITAIIRRGLHSSSQLPVRLSLLLIVTLEFLAGHLGLDVLLGAFAAGMIVRIAVAGRGEQHQVEIFRGKLEAVGFGFLVPVFFIVSGMNLDLRTFGHHPAALALIPAYLLLLLVIRGVPTLWVYRQDLPKSSRHALALMAATGLPLIVVITTIGQAYGYISAENAAALVTAGMLSVLLFPVIGLRVALGRQAGAEAAERAAREGTA
jgi:Kef-type K+ transport system membrane component KefB